MLDSNNSAAEWRIAGPAPADDRYTGGEPSRRESVVARDVPDENRAEDVQVAEAWAEYDRAHAAWGKRRAEIIDAVDNNKPMPQALPKPVEPAGERRAQGAGKGGAPPGKGAAHGGKGAL